MKTCYAAAIATALTALPAVAGHAQAKIVIDRYSFSSSAAMGTDSGVAANNATAGASVTAGTVGTDGVANFTTVANDPAANYIQYSAGAQLTGITNTLSTLQNGTFEFYATSVVAANTYQPLFSIGNGTGYPETGDRYFILSANRGGGVSGTGIGTGTSVNGFANEENFGTGTNLTAFPNGYGVIDFVYSGFTTVGSTGTLTIYVNGVAAAAKSTIFSPAYTVTGGGIAGAPTQAGIGGGSNFNDPTFGGGLSEFRIYNFALTQNDIANDIVSGPNGAPAPEPSQVASLGLGVLGLAGLAFKARKRLAS